MRYPDKVVMTTATKSADVLLSADASKDTYLIDIARCDSGVNIYSALEQLKNGFVTDAKLKKNARVVCMRPPHVIVFSNVVPDEEARRYWLSQDRWIIVKL